MTIKTTAAVLRKAGLPAPYAESQPLSIEDVTLDPPKPMEVVVKVVGAGLCHSDLSVINGSLGRGLPVVIGHEGAGEVVEVGAAVTDVKVGDHIAFQFSPSCGRCAKCQAGRPQICEPALRAKSKGELMAGGTRLKDANGEPLKHMVGVACYAQYVVADRGSIVVIDPTLPLHEAALFGCAVMTGVGAVMNTAKVRPGDTVAVFGLGGVGLCGVMGARLAGAETIVAVDLEDAKLQKAAKLGATHTFNARDPDVIGKIKELTKGGVDHALDLAGAIPALESAYAVTGIGGQCITAGLAPMGSTMTVNQPEMVVLEKKLVGSYMGSCVPVRDIPRFISLYQQGRLPVDELIDEIIGFDQLNVGFDRLNAGTALRQVLAPHGARDAGARVMESAAVHAKAVV